MRIILMRHGPPMLNKNRWISLSKLQQWIDRYDACGIDHSTAPDNHTLEMIRDCRTVVCSDIERSIDSAQRLGYRNPTHVNHLFSEIPLPVFSLPLPPLPVKWWLLLFRTLWFMRIHGGTETYPQARHRADIAAAELIQLACRYDTVLLIGHGLNIRMITKALHDKGWRGPASPPDGYWGAAEYISPDTGRVSPN
jgi:broad specificity phosphatase PhoE